MRELDVLLVNWLEHRYAAASEAQKAVFEALLQLPDPELAAYLLQGRTASTAEAARVIDDIRRNDSP